MYMDICVYVYIHILICFYDCRGGVCTQDGNMTDLCMYLRIHIGTVTNSIRLIRSTRTRGGLGFRIPCTVYCITSYTHSPTLRTNRGHSERNNVVYWKTKRKIKNDLQTQYGLTTGKPESVSKETDCQIFQRACYSRIDSCVVHIIVGQPLCIKCPIVFEFAVVSLKRPARTYYYTGTCV